MAFAIFPANFFHESSAVSSDDSALKIANLLSYSNLINGFTGCWAKIDIRDMKSSSEQKKDQNEEKKEERFFYIKSTRKMFARAARAEFPFLPGVRSLSSASFQPSLSRVRLFPAGHAARDGGCLLRRVRERLHGIESPSTSSSSTFQQRVSILTERRRKSKRFQKQQNNKKWWKLKQKSTRVSFLSKAWFLAKSFKTYEIYQRLVSYLISHHQILSLHLSNIGPI